MGEGGHAKGAMGVPFSSPPAAARSDPLACPSSSEPLPLPLWLPLSEPGRLPLVGATKFEAKSTLDDLLALSSVLTFKSAALKRTSNHTADPDHNSYSIKPSRLHCHSTRGHPGTGYHRLRMSTSLPKLVSPVLGTWFRRFQSTLQSYFGMKLEDILCG